MRIAKSIALYIPRLVVIALCVSLLTGCGFRQWMYNQPKAKNYRESEFFADNRGARPLVPNTVAVGSVQVDELLYTGQVNGQDAEVMPFPVTADVLDRGELQFNVYCSPCHGLSGYGDGMVARRGGTPPTNYHTDYLRDKPAGYIFRVMTYGFRNMRSYSSKLSAEDRWAIVAYVRALQLSQNATEADLPPAQSQPQGAEQ